VKTNSGYPEEIITRAGPPVVHAGLFGGVGEVRVWNLLRGAAEPFTAALSCELSAGGSIGRHVQDEFPEIVIGIQGEGVAVVNGVAHRLGALSAVHLPLAATLEIVNHSHVESLRYVIVKAHG
jgi:quercetin dioxygenase-like cupin family protein